MVSPADNPCVKRHSSTPEQQPKQSSSKRNNYDAGDKENATRRSNRSPRIGITERVLQPADPLKQHSTANEKRGVPLVRDDVLPRKRRFGDAISPLASPLAFGGGESSSSAHACERVKKRVSRWDQGPEDEKGYNRDNDTRVNPFDGPLPKLGQRAAPIRSYRHSKTSQKVYTRTEKTILDPPPRMLVSYADLWDGVSSINKMENDFEEWDDDGYSASYDFLYDGVWTRCVGRLMIPVEKVFHRSSLSWTMERHSSGRKRRRRFRDLDRPDAFEDLWNDMECKR